MNMKSYRIVVIVCLCVVTMFGCKQKVSDDVCNMEAVDSLYLGNHVFVMDNDSIVRICDVQWRVNRFCDDSNVVLFTSVQPDDSKMKSVIQLFDSIYGKHEEVVEARFYWQGARMRRVQSEEGGTFLFGMISKNN